VQTSPEWDELLKLQKELNMGRFLNVEMHAMAAQAVLDARAFRTAAAAPIYLEGGGVNRLFRASYKAKNARILLLCR
jgi:hypothetical protein